jgi:hypothetical protein
VFFVRMHTLSGTIRSAASNEIRIFVNVPAPPPPPQNLQGLVNGSALTLSWTNPPASSANLWLHVSGAISITLPLPMGETFSYRGVPAGTYTLSVSASSAGGMSAPSNSVTLSFPTDCSGIPGAPTNLQAWKVGDVIYLLWNSPVGGPAVTGYRVAVSGAYQGSFATVARSISGRAARGTYDLSVSATNVCGAGPPTPSQTVVIP